MNDIEKLDDCNWIPYNIATSPHLKTVEFLLLLILLVHPQPWVDSQWPHSLWPHSLLLPSVVCSSASNEKRSTTSSNTFGKTAGMGIETNIIQHDLYEMQTGKNISSMVVHPFYQTNPKEVFGYSLCGGWILGPWFHMVLLLLCQYTNSWNIYWQ